jgi:hypothetical protein
VLIHFDSTLPGACPLSEAQSRALLQFCRRLGAATFTVNFLYVKGEDSEQAAKNFYQRLSAFSAGDRVLENICGEGFQRQECWVLTDESIDTIMTETVGNLFAYNVLYLPEDWLFYVGDAVLLQVVSHEQEATLRLPDDRYAEFTRLGIQFEEGQPRWSTLPESPTGSADLFL